MHYIIHFIAEEKIFKAITIHVLYPIAEMQYSTLVRVD